MRLAIYIVPLCCFSANAQYRFDHWTNENGLPINWIKGIRQTRDGYLWLTTAQGVARFDGVRFRIFNRANTPMLSSDRFSLYAIFEDREGSLWMGTEDGGVIVYRNGDFSALTSAQGLPSDTVLRIDEDEEGAVWIFTNNGLARWKDNQLTRVAPSPNSPFNDFLSAPRNLPPEAKYFGLWRVESNSWQRFAHGKWEVFPLPVQVTNPAQVQITYIIEDTHERIWYKIAGRPDECYRVENGILTTTRGFTKEQIVFFQDHKERQWGADGQKGSFVRLKDGTQVALTDWSPGILFQMFEDREETLWVATLNHGLYRIRKQVFTVYLHPGGEASNNIQPLMQDRAGNVWVGSGGLARFADDRFQNFYQPGVSHSPVFERNVLISLFEDGDGSFWLGVRDGISRFRNGLLERDEALSAQIKGWVHAIQRGRAGSLWFGSEDGLYELRDGKVTRFVNYDDQAEALEAVGLRE